MAGRAFSARWMPSWGRATGADGLSARQARALAASRRVARLMDAQWGIGRARFGVETAVELVPVLGEISSVAMALFQLRVARTLGVPAGSLLRILLTSLFAGVVGVIPVAGDLFNTVFKVHVRNHRVIEEYVQRTYPGAARAGR